MLKFASDYDISYKLDDSDEKLLQDSLDKITEDIKSIKGSIGWLWGTGDKDARLFCIQRVIDETGHTPNQEDLPKDLRKKKKKLLGQRGKEKE